MFKALERHLAFLGSSGRINEKRAHFAKTAIMHIVRDLAAQRAEEELSTSHGLKLLEKISERRLDPFNAANQLFSKGQK